MRADEPDDDPFAEAPDQPPVPRRAPLTWRRPADGRPVYGIDPGAPLPNGQPPDFGPVVARLAAAKLGVPVESIRMMPPAMASAPFPPVGAGPLAAPPPAYQPPPAAFPAAPAFQPPPPWPMMPPGPPPEPWFAWPRHSGAALTPEQEWAARGEAISQFAQSFGGLPPAPPPPQAWQQPPAPDPWAPPPGPWVPAPPPEASAHWLLAAFVLAVPLPPVGLACAAVAYMKARAAQRPTAPALAAGALACATVAGLAVFVAVVLA